MDFVFGLPHTERNHDGICVNVDRLTKSSHFLAIRIYYSLDGLVELYINETLRLHEIRVSIVSKSDLTFTYEFWGSFQETLDTKLKFSFLFHSEKNC